MSAVATAIVGGAVVTGYLGSQAADKAAKASAKGADAASQVQWDMYDQSRKDQMPWLGTGKNALKQLAALNGVAYSDNASSAPPITSYQAQEGALHTAGDINQLYRAVLGRDVDPSGLKYYQGWDASSALADIRGSQEYRDKAANGLLPQLETSGGNTSPSSSSSGPDYSAFYNSPDYQFTFAEGKRAVNSGLAARGLSNSGRAMKELTRYGQGAASAQLNSYRNQLAAMAGIGQQTATNLAGQGSQTASQVGQNTQNAADARASGYLGSANSWNNSINSAVGLGAYGKTNKWWGK